MKHNWKLLPAAALKLTYFYGTLWQNTDTCNTNQQAITALTNAGSHHHGDHLQAIALSLPREVNLPGCPEGGQLWSRSALTSNQPGRRNRNGKTAAPHPSIIPQTPTQKCKMQPSLSFFPPFLSYFSPLFFFFLVPSHLAWHGAVRGSGSRMS